MTSQQKVYLINESQRDALLSYLQGRPYKEVANGIQFLVSAPTAMLNVTVDDGKVTSATLSAAGLDADQPETTNSEQANDAVTA